jgi:hypothetical protein
MISTGRDGYFSCAGAIETTSTAASAAAAVNARCIAFISDSSSVQ